MIQKVGRHVEETFDFARRGEKPQKQFGEVGLFAGLGKNDEEESVDGFGHETTIVGQAGQGEKADTIGFFKDGDDAGVVAVANLFGGREDGDPDALALPLRTHPKVGFNGHGKRIGNGGVGATEPGEKLDEGVETGVQRAGTGKIFGPIGKFVERAAALLGRGKQGKDEVASRFQGPPMSNLEQ